MITPHWTRQALFEAASSFDFSLEPLNAHPTVQP
jgi:hypothetical protein